MEKARHTVYMYVYIYIVCDCLCIGKSYSSPPPVFLLCVDTEDFSSDTSGHQRCAPPQAVLCDTHQVSCDYLRSDTVDLETGSDPACSGSASQDRPPQLHVPTASGGSTVPTTSVQLSNCPTVRLGAN